MSDNRREAGLESEMKSCFFIGHRDAGVEVRPLLIEAVERHITEYGVTTFYVGHYGSFDHMAARAVIDAKKRHPSVTLWMLLPYHPYDQPVEAPDGFDGTYYPPGMERIPKRFAIVRANEYMTKTSTHLIAYAWHTLSGVGKLVKFARTLEKKGRIRIENLAEKMG